MKVPLAWIDEEGSGVAFVFDDGLAAVRDLAGAWKVSPGGVTIGALASDGYKLAEPGEAAALGKAARMALSESPVRDE